MQCPLGWGLRSSTLELGRAADYWCCPRASHAFTSSLSLFFVGLGRVGLCGLHAVSDGLLSFWFAVPACLISL
ncbi:hypothetical protein NC651_022012 [Populus alba x Populus x berolinensis]|nr:hypothetical protein NC651_022012 [Populus alba x Populus x berolinensis]